MRFTSAIETAPKITDSAFGTVRGGTRRMVSDADIAQNPPSASPRQARPIKSKLNELAKETSKQESVSKTAKENNNVAAVSGLNCLGNKQTGKHCHKGGHGHRLPGNPFRKCVLAIGVNKLTGKNSTIIRQATQNATEKTADQFGRVMASAPRFSAINSLMVLPVACFRGSYYFTFKCVTHLTFLQLLRCCGKFEAARRNKNHRAS